jgi:hypothetical protein
MDNNKENFFLYKKHKIKIILFLFLIIVFFLIALINIFQRYNYKDKLKVIYRTNEEPMNEIQLEKNKISHKTCYLNFDISNIRIIHIIITRFLIFISKEFSENLYKEDYILNGIRVMKKYLFPSLENQSCKNFTWILILGNQANITHIKSLLNLNNSFESKVLYQKDLRKYLKNITKGFDILITTRIDYDDRIYYDAVNDVRKAININRPMIIYGYNRGLYYFELNDKYYDFYNNFKNEGAMSIFISLIIVLNKVNDTYSIYDLGNHVKIRKTLLETYKSYGIKELNYEPCIFDNGAPKFVYVRQNYSWYINYTRKILKNNKIKDFSINKFYGK